MHTSVVTSHRLSEHHLTVSLLFWLTAENTIPWIGTSLLLFQGFVWKHKNPSSRSLCTKMLLTIKKYCQMSGQYLSSHTEGNTWQCEIHTLVKWKVLPSLSLNMMWPKIPLTLSTPADSLLLQFSWKLTLSSWLIHIHNLFVSFSSSNGSVRRSYIISLNLCTSDIMWLSYLFLPLTFLSSPPTRSCSSKSELPVWSPVMTWRMHVCG